MDEQLCPHCTTHPLLIDRERDNNCCDVCRRYGLLLGRWPNPLEEKKMKIQLTDEQIARVFELAEKITVVQQSIHWTPGGFARSETIRLEIAKSLRASLEAQTDVLLELGTLLRPEPEFADDGSPILEETPGFLAD